MKIVVLAGGLSPERDVPLSAFCPRRRKRWASPMKSCAEGLRRMQKSSSSAYKNSIFVHIWKKMEIKL